MYNLGRLKCFRDDGINVACGGHFAFSGYPPSQGGHIIAQLQLKWPSSFQNRGRERQRGVKCFNLCSSAQNVLQSWHGDVVQITLHPHPTVLPNHVAHPVATPVATRTASE